MAERKKPRPGGAAAGFFAVVTVLLLALSALLSVGKAYHFRLAINTEQVSPTVTGADERTDLDLISELLALSMEEDLALPALFDPDSSFNQDLSRIASVADTVQQIMDYLGSYDIRFGGDNTMVNGIETLLSTVADGKLLLVFYALGTALCLLLTLVLLLSGRRLGGCLLGGLSALLLGGLPLGLIAAVQRSAARFHGMLAAAARYGIGVSASLTLNATGKAQVLFAAAALLTTAACLFSMALTRPGKKNG